MKFTDHLNKVFSAENNDYDAAKNLMFDLAQGREIYSDGKKISKTQANDVNRKVVFEILDLPTEGKITKRDIRRAMNYHGRELFDVIEDVVDLKVEEGFTDNEFFNEFVDRKSIAQDDIIEFYVEDNSVLNVAHVSGENNDYTLQRLGAGETFTIPVYKYGAAVGASITRYLLGQDDWETLTDKLAQAFVTEVQNQVYAATMDAKNKIPAQAQFVGNGALTADNKDAFDEIIENVAAINGTDVVIMGTKTALKKLNNLTDVDWRANSQKESVANTGRLGSYEGTDLIEIPQRFAVNDVTKKLVDDKTLLIMPLTNDNKFVKVVDSGETEINEVTEKGEAGGRFDDIMKFQEERSFGVGVVLGRYFGAWTLA